MTNKLIIGLGSNIGDKNSYLNQAIELLKKNNVIFNVKSSPIYVSKALLIENSPPEWNIDFFNMVLTGKTNLEVIKILEEIKKIEKELGRKDRGKWAPREIDIDIIAIDNLVINQDLITIPHKEMLNRDFVLVPLSDIDNEWTYPVEDSRFYGKTAKEILTIMYENNYHTENCLGESYDSFFKSKRIS